MIRVCLADDQVLVRSGISALLQASGEIDVVAEVSDGFEAIKAIVRLAPF
jgi:DNA-binding NarL/FixJ family response regulator